MFWAIFSSPGHPVTVISGRFDFNAKFFIHMPEAVFEEYGDRDPTREILSLVCRDCYLIASKKYYL